VLAWLRFGIGRARAADHGVGGCGIAARGKRPPTGF
jgi:hypothetical protein